MGCNTRLPVVACQSSHGCWPGSAGGALALLVDIGNYVRALTWRRVAAVVAGLIGVWLGVMQGLPPWAYERLPEVLSANVAKLIMVFLGMLTVLHALLWRWIEGNAERLLKRIDYVWYGGSILAVALAIADFETGHHLRLLDELRSRVDGMTRGVQEHLQEVRERSELVVAAHLPIHRHLCERRRFGLVDEKISSSCAIQPERRRRRPFTPFFRKTLEQLCGSRALEGEDFESQVHDASGDRRVLAYVATALRVMLCGVSAAAEGAKVQRAIQVPADDLRFDIQSLAVTESTASSRVGFLDLPVALGVSAFRTTAQSRGRTDALEAIQATLSWRWGKHGFGFGSGDGGGSWSGSTVSGGSPWESAKAEEIVSPASPKRAAEVTHANLDIGCRTYSSEGVGSSRPFLFPQIIELGEGIVVNIPADSALDECQLTLRLEGPDRPTLPELIALHDALDSASTVLVEARALVEDDLVAARSQSDRVSWWPFVLAVVIALRLCKTTAEVRAADRKARGGT